MQRPGQGPRGRGRGPIFVESCPVGLQDLCRCAGLSGRSTTLIARRTGTWTRCAGTLTVPVRSCDGTIPEQTSAMSTRGSLLIGACAGAFILVAMAVETGARGRNPLALADAAQIDASREETAVLEELLADRRAKREDRAAQAKAMQAALEELS